MNEEATLGEMLGRLDEELQAEENEGLNEVNLFEPTNDTSTGLPKKKPEQDVTEEQPQEQGDVKEKNATDEDEDVYTHLEKKGFTQEEIEFLVESEKFKLPKDYTGNPKYYKTAEQLLERRRIREEKYGSASREAYNAINREVKELRELVASWKSDENKEKITNTLRGVEARMQEAIETGDVQETKALISKRDELLKQLNTISEPIKAQAKEEPQYPAEQLAMAKHYSVTPEVYTRSIQEFNAENDHIFAKYGQEAINIAVAAFEKMALEKPTLSLAGNLRHCEKVLNEFYTKKQNTERAQQPSNVPSFVTPQPVVKAPDRTLNALNTYGRSILDALKDNHPRSRHAEVEALFIEQHKHIAEYFKK